MVRIGLIGCGRIAQIFHLKALLQNPKIRVTALAEADPGRLAQAKLMCADAKTFTAYEELLAQAVVDAVVICLPSHMHAASAIEAFRNGKHVYLEKPMAIAIEEAESVRKAWRESLRVGMIGFNFRYHPLYQELREKLQSGSVGALTGARAVISSAARTLPDWKRKRATGGGVLLDLASHHFDLVSYLFSSEIHSVRATLRSIRVENDTASKEVILASGLVVQSLLSMSSIEEHSFEVYGVRGRLGLDRIASQKVEVFRPAMPYDRIHRIWNAFGALRPSVLLKPPGEPSFAAALNAFISAVCTGSQVKPDLDDGHSSLVGVLAAEESARTGSAVRVGRLQMAV